MPIRGIIAQTARKSLHGQGDLVGERLQEMELLRGASRCGSAGWTPSTPTIPREVRSGR